MQKNQQVLNKFTNLKWEDLNDWAGGKIVSRGRTYQKQGVVSELAVTDDGALIAWVEGSEQYATRVALGEDGLLESICTCPYELDCKHAVAVVLEYLERCKNNRPVPRAKKGDDRLALFEFKERDTDKDKPILPAAEKTQIDEYLKCKTKAQLIELIHELADNYPEISQDLRDRQQILSGDVKSLVTHLRREIREIGEKPGWQDYWQDKGYTPDYSGIRIKLEKLLKAGHTETVLAQGEELIKIGTRQVEQSHDEGETAMEIESCMPIIVMALDQSSMETADKLAWAVDAVLKDNFEICRAFAKYLYQKHPKAAWHTLADRLLERLNIQKASKSTDDFCYSFARDQLSNWAIHALERAGRKEEIISLCKAEAKRTNSYERLVRHLIDVHRYEDAEHWIQEGIRSTREKWPGIASSLRDKLREIRTRQRNWPIVAAIQAEEFVCRLSLKAFTECKLAADKVKAWADVRGCLLLYLEKGALPWSQKSWPLPESGLEPPEIDRGGRFPRIDVLIEIAIHEKKPDQVLHWYDRLSKEQFGWHRVNEDAIATAVQTQAPDQAVSIWKNKAERLISLVKPSAYQEAAKYLRKAEKLMIHEKKQEEWDRYLKKLRAEHIRKNRFIEILDGFDNRPIVGR